VEADGGEHYEPAQKEYDEQRTETFRHKGFKVVRFSDVEVLKYPDAVGRAIYRELTGESPVPVPWHAQTPDSQLESFLETPN
jgi:very-short-patch-repair endonuclease